MGPSSVSIAEDSDDSNAFSFVDEYLIDLPAGMFDPKPTLGYVVVLGLVFESPVRSGLLALIALDRNRNRSSIFETLRKTGPDRQRPVFCGSLRL
jgi:hypothetical protein